MIQFFYFIYLFYCSQFGDYKQVFGLQQKLLMRKNNQDNWLALDRPFLIFPSTPTPSHRNKLSRMQRSLHANNQSHAYMRQSRSFIMDKASPTEFDFNKDINDSNNVFQQIETLVENSKVKAKELITQNAALLREQIWLRVEGMFRKIEQIGQKFHDQVYTAVTMSEGRPESLTKQVQNSLMSYINNFGTLYSNERTNKIMSKIIDKVSKYLDEVIQKYGSSLFHFQAEPKSHHGQGQGYGQNSQEISYDLQFNRSRNLQSKAKNSINQGLSDRKYMSLQKYKHNQTTAKSPSISIVDFKSKQQRVRAQNSFNEVYRTIKQSKQRQKQRSNKADGSMQVNNEIQFNAYGLTPRSYAEHELTLKQKQKMGQSKHSRLSSFYSQALRDLPTRAPLAMSQANSTSYAKDMRSNNVTISPVISRVRADDDQTKAQRTNNKLQLAIYSVARNQQSANMQWCEEINLSGELTTVSIASSFEKETNKQLGKKSVPLCLTYCNNFQHLAIGCQNSFIYIYGLQPDQPQQIAVLKGHGSSVCTLHYDSHILFSGGDIQCCSIYLWCTTNWTMRSKLNFHSAAISSIISISNTDCIVSASYDKTLKLYNYRTSEILSSKNEQNRPYLAVLYFEQMQKIVAMTPTAIIDVFEVDLANGNQFGLKNQQGIACGAQVQAIQKADNVLIAGLANGSIQIFTLPDKSFIKRVEVSCGPIISMLAFNRSTKPHYPILLCACLSSRSLHMINTETGYSKQLNVKGNMKIVVGGGISPVMVIGDGSRLAWVEQDAQNAKFHCSRFDIH